MCLTKAKKNHTCKHCHDDIWKGVWYYPQRRNKSLCVECGKPKDKNSFMSWLMDKLK